DSDTPDLAAQFANELFLLDGEGRVVGVNLNSTTLVEYVRVADDARERGFVPRDQEAVVKILLQKPDWNDESISIQGLAVGTTSEALIALAEADPNTIPPDGSLVFQTVGGQSIPLFVGPQENNDDSITVMHIHENGSADVTAMQDVFTALVKQIDASFDGASWSDERVQRMKDIVFQRYLKIIGKSHVDEKGNVIIDETCHVDRTPLEQMMRMLSSLWPKLRIVGPLTVLNNDNKSGQGFADLTDVSLIPRKDANGIADGFFVGKLYLTRFEELLGDRDLNTLLDEEIADLIMKSLRFVDGDVSNYERLPSGYLSDGKDDTGKAVNPELHQRQVCGPDSIDLTATPTVTMSPEEEITVTYPSPSGTPRATGTPTPTRTPESTPTSIPTNPRESTATPMPPGTPAASPVPEYTQWAPQTPAGDPENTPTPGSAPTSVFETSVPVPTVTPIAP
ncbi:MAG TPA: hypothetical protein DCX25_01670, partial [Candidatus Pacebacteria bacterium]|nr:hypothetical protein [Candidatus Paceibacterota bacterium]